MSDNPTPAETAADDAPINFGRLRLARNITVTRTRKGGDGFAVTIDGHEFPFYLGIEGAHASVVPGEAPRVTLTIIAESVDIDDALLVIEPDEDDVDGE